MPLHISVEPWRNVRPFMKPLLDLHYAEAGHDQDRIPLEMDWDRYDALSREGRLVVVGARRDGRLCGYLTAFLTTHLHHRNTLFGILDLIYLHPADRAGWAGVRLFRVAEQAMKDRGAQKLSGALSGALDISPIFRRLGWRQEGGTFTKWIG